MSLTYFLVLGITLYPIFYFMFPDQRDRLHPVTYLGWVILSYLCARAFGTPPQL